MLNFNQTTLRGELVDDIGHKIHMPQYRKLIQFSSDPYLPYLGNCPICQDIDRDNKVFVENRDNVKIDY